MSGEPTVLLRSANLSSGRSTEDGPAGTVFFVAELHPGLRWAEPARTNVADRASGRRRCGNLGRGTNLGARMSDPAR